MIAEKKIKEFDFTVNIESFERMKEFADANGVDPYVVEDQITLKFLPAQFDELIESYGLNFKHFVLSGYHGLRYGKNKMILTGIYNYVEPEKNKEFKVDLKSLFSSDNVLEMYISATRFLDGEEDDGKITLKEVGRSEVIETILSSLRGSVAAAVWNVE
jgi:hypothetical protein